MFMTMGGGAPSQKRPVHSQLKKARGEHVLSSAPAPRAKQPIPSAAAPFFAREALGRNQIQAAIREKMTTGQITPFQLNLGNGHDVTITNIAGRELGHGEHSTAYWCEVAGKGHCVVKLYRDYWSDQILNFTANQLLNYTFNKQNGVPTATFHNFEPHTAQIAPILGERGYAFRLNRAKEYARTNLSGITVAQFIPHPAPLDDFDLNNPDWLQLRDLIKRRDGNDCSRDNIRFDDDGKALLVDVLERELEPGMSSKDHAASLSDDPAVQNWLLGE
jgi:hypothetical protein